MPKPVPCPYSTARLREMYWREVWTLAEIARHASGVLGFSLPLGHNVAKRWLLEARISIRTAGESLSLRAIRNTPGVEILPKLKPGKRCRGFGRTPHILPRSEFWRDSSRKDGLCGLCKTCQNTRSSAYFRTRYYPSRRRRIIERTLTNRAKRKGRNS